MFYVVGGFYALPTVALHFAIALLQLSM